MPDAGGLIRFVILAAGTSSRMGENKLLVRLHGKPLLQWVVDALLPASEDPITVVTGHENQLITDCLTIYGDRVSMIHNPHYFKGRSSSIKRALEFLDESVCAVLITPGDVPLISTELVIELLNGFRQSGKITFPLVQGRKGHPTIFPRESFDMLMSLTGDQTLNDYMLTHSAGTNPLVWSDDRCLMDADTAEDYEALVHRLAEGD